jgi:tripartite-type tricarboxylate transporter receptor subunit TctC
MKLQRREVLLQAMTGASVIFIAAPSWAETWPAKTIRLVVPFPPGGLIDNMARLLGTQLTQELGQTIVVEKTNLPSAISQVQAGKLTALGGNHSPTKPRIAECPDDGRGRLAHCGRTENIRCARESVEAA